MNGVFTHYRMQLGSGTWDFWPSLTYTGRADRLAWGAHTLARLQADRTGDPDLLSLGKAFLKARFDVSFTVLGFVLAGFGLGAGGGQNYIVTHARPGGAVRLLGNLAGDLAARDRIEQRCQGMALAVRQFALLPPTAPSAMYSIIA